MPRPETRDCRGPLSTKSLLKKKVHAVKSSTERPAWGSIFLPALSLDHREDCQGPRPVPVTSLDAFLILDPMNISLSRFPPTQSRALEHIQTCPHLPVQKPPVRARPAVLNRGDCAPRRPLAMSGGISVVTTGEGVLLASRSRGQGAVKASYDEDNALPPHLHFPIPTPHSNDNKLSSPKCQQCQGRETLG